MARIMVAILRFYSSYISPIFPRHCRYYPTCSSYAVQAFEQKGFLEALSLSIWRVLRCNPFSAGGYDPLE